MKDLKKPGMWIVAALTILWVISRLPQAASQALANHRVTMARADAERAELERAKAGPRKKKLWVGCEFEKEKDLHILLELIDNEEAHWAPTEPGWTFDMNVNGKTMPAPVDDAGKIKLGFDAGVYSHRVRVNPDQHPGKGTFIWYWKQRPGEAW